MLTIHSETAARQIAQAIATFNAGGKINQRGFNSEAKTYIRVFIDEYLSVAEIPDEVLKIFLNRLVATCGDNTVAMRRSKVWLDLNIYPQDNRHHTERDLRQMEQFFARCDAAGYVIFNTCGSIWRIDLC